MKWQEDRYEEARWLIDSLEASSRRRARLKFAYRGSARLLPVLEEANREINQERRRIARMARRLTKLLPGGRRRLALRIVRHAYRSEQAMLASALVGSMNAQTRYIDFVVAEQQRHLSIARRAALEHIARSLNRDLPRRADGGPGH